MIKNQNVNLWFAKNEQDKIVTIDEINTENKTKYYCPLCGSEVIPKAININNKVSPHFAHLDKNKCSLESMIHFWVKNKLLNTGDKFTIQTEIEKEYICKDIIIEKTYKTSYGDYKPDLTIKTECGETIYFEIKYNNKKEIKNYIDKWIQLGKTVVEIDSKELINFDKLCFKFKALFSNNKCYNVRKNDSYFNTIGVYKQQLKKSRKYSKHKEQLEKLDWLWDEILNYSKEKSNIEKIVELIDCIENSEEKVILKEILSDKKCINVVEDYIKYKNEYIENIIKYNCNKYNISNKQFKTHYCSNSYLKYHFFNSTTTIHYTLSNAYYKETLEIFKHNLKHIKNTIENICIFVKNIDDYNNNYNKLYFLLEEYYKNEFINISCHLSCWRSNIEYDEIIIKGFKELEEIKFKINFSEVYVFKYKLWNNNNNYKDCIKINFTHDNINKIFEFMCNIINKNIDEINIVLEDVETKMEIISEEQMIDFDLFIDKVVNIFENNKNKILEYEINYDDITNLKNGLYFKDYRDKEFIIHITPSGYYFDRNKMKSILMFDKYRDKNNLIFINSIYFYRLDEFLFVETLEGYEFCKKLNIQYNYKTYINKNIINFSFKNIDSTYRYLERYDFIKSTNKISKLLIKINNYIKNYKTTINVNKIYNSVVKIKNEDIDNEIYKILYPLICLSDKEINDCLNVKLNIDFTKNENGKLRPWLIKEFLNYLELINIKNIENII